MTIETGHERHVPEIRFPDELPVSARREDIAELIEQHQVVILAGETGSGKTTQLPKICLALGRGRRARIGHTQPRRLAARTVAQRIADELNTPLGALVGYQVRFHDQVSDETGVKLMTDGILLAELQRDAGESVAGIKLEKDATKLLEAVIAGVDEIHQADAAVCYSLAKRNCHMAELYGDVGKYVYD